MADAPSMPQSPVQSPVKSFDQPILAVSSLDTSLAHTAHSHSLSHAPIEDAVVLTHSAATREATTEDDIPGALRRKYAANALVRVGDIPIDHPEVPKDSQRFEVEQPKSSDHGPGVASPVMNPHDKLMTEIRAGYVAKPFYIHTELLVQRSPYFAAMQNTPENPQPSHRLSGPFFFSYLDEFAFAIFKHWIYGGDLHGPDDFHSMNHYLCLYVLAKKFQIESLTNHTMDLIRQYYVVGDMTAPAFRLEYVYANTDSPNLMREFLVLTAAYRALADADAAGVISDSVRGALQKGGDLAPDFAQALCTLVKNDREDARRGDPCRYHEHKMTEKCPKWGGFEPWQDA